MFNSRLEFSYQSIVTLVEFYSPQKSVGANRGNVIWEFD